METSIFLAKVIGLVSIISVTAVVSHYKRPLSFDEESVKSPLFIYVSGFVFLVFGVLLVVSHSVWVFDWRLVITILSWSVLLKGVGRIFFPDAVRRLKKRKI